MGCGVAAFELVYAVGSRVRVTCLGMGRGEFERVGRDRGLVLSCR